MAAKHPRIGLVVAQAVITLLTYALPLLVPAGIAAWPSAWIFLGLWLGFWFVILVWLFRQNPDLFWERMNVRTADQKGWDKIVGPLIYVAMFLWLLFTAFDAARFHWSPVPAWLQVAGCLILLLSFALFFLTFRANAFLSPLVRIQKDRGQTVISTGPYRYVRHPMYAATLVFIVGTPLLLGAWFGLFGGPLVAAVLAWRSVLEEKSLQRDLPGYREYTERVRYRLIPFLW